MKFYTVDVKNITSNIPSSNFANDELNSLADIIITSGGLIRPLVLKMAGLEAYEVIDGHFEYYAAVRAREKNPRQCEMVNAFVISPNNEDDVFKQVVAFKELNYSNPNLVEKKIPKNAGNETHILESNSVKQELDLLKQQFSDLSSELAQEKQEREKLYEFIKLLENQIPKQITPLESFNHLNLLELTFRLRTAGFADKKAIQIVEKVDEERKKKKFESLKDVVQRVMGMSSDKMVNIVDTWSRVLFS